MRVVLFCLTLFLATSAGAQPAIRWQKCLGGSGDDKLQAIAATADGGFLTAGSTKSNDNMELFGRIANDSTDAYVVKLRSDGSAGWQRCYGSTGNDRANDIKATPDGGGIFGGYNDSVRGPWVVKFGVDGSVQWQNANIDGFLEIVSIALAQDGGYMLAGGIESSGGGYGWLAKLAHDGVLQWKKTYGKDLSKCIGDNF